MCEQFEIEHRLNPPLHPQTNGMVERFNNRIGDIVNQTRFGAAAELERFVTTSKSTTPTVINPLPVEVVRKWWVYVFIIDSDAFLLQFCFHCGAGIG